MKTSELINKLKNMDCRKCILSDGCPGFCKAQECRIIDAAIDRLESLEKEREACFRLGQMDMRETVTVMLRNAADNTFGISRSTLRSAAEMVTELETQ